MVNSRPNTADVPLVVAKGLSSQRQLDALTSAHKYFGKEHVHSARVSTGIDIEYVLHSTNNESSSSEPLPVDRVVLIMGFLQAKESWAAVIDMLLDKYTAAQPRKNVQLLAFDNRGVGGSSAPWWRYTTSQMARDTLALLDHVQWGAANIVGISMGGMISLELAALAPQRVQSLSLLVTTRGKYVADPRASAPLRKSTFSKDATEAVTNLLELLYPLDVIRANRMDATASDTSVYDALFAFHSAARRQRVKPRLVGMLGQVLAIRTHFVSDDRLIQIKKAGFPILLVGCMRDILIPPIESIKLKERLDAPNVETLFFQDGGHGVTIQYIEEVADGLAATFQRASKL